MPKIKVRPIEEMYRRGWVRTDQRGRLVINAAGRTIRLPTSEVKCLASLREALARKKLLRRGQIETLCQPHAATEQVLFGTRQLTGFEALA